MARLIDDIRTADRIEMPFLVDRSREKEWKAHTLRVRELLCMRGPQELPVIRIDNVAEYHAASEQEYWDLTVDFPNLAPPFQAFWMEHRLPTKMHSAEKGDTDMSMYVQGGRVGMFIVALSPSEVKTINTPDGPSDIDPQTKWIYWIEPVIDFGRLMNRGIEYSFGPVFMQIDAEGRLLDRPWVQSFAAPGNEEVVRSLIHYVYPAMLAISFLHCKNVQIETEPADEKMDRLFRKKHKGIQRARMKVLVIEPLKQILRKEGGAGAGNSLAKAMHICRGHFKDYREGRGLFGKYHQLVWQPSIVRGTKGKKAPPREIEVKI